MNVVVFAEDRLVASGLLTEVAGIAKKAVDAGRVVLVFDAETSRQVEVDFRGSVADVIRRVTAKEHIGSTEERERKGPGRPKLGVVGREVTLLPRHWDWLNLQPGGASVALRKLVEEGRKKNASKDATRAAQESAYRFMLAMAGNLPNYEEGLRAMYSGNLKKFRWCVRKWPKDVRTHSIALAKRAIAS